MTGDLNHVVAARSTPMAPRLAILLLMAGVLVYGWQSIGVKASQGLSGSSADVDVRKALRTSTDPRHSTRGELPVDPQPSPEADGQVRNSGAAAVAAAGTIKAHGTAGNGTTACLCLYGLLNCTLFWCFMPAIPFVILLLFFPARLQQCFSWLNDWGGLLLAVSVFILLLSASWGFQKLRETSQQSATKATENAAQTMAAESSGRQDQQQPERVQHTVLHDLYQMLQLLNFNTEPDKLTGSLLLAACCVIVITLLAAREILRTLFYDLLVQMQLFLFSRRHIVVVGLGRLGRQIIETMLSDKVHRRRPIVVLERDPQNPNLKWARQNGLLLVQGDGSEAEDLKRVRLLKAVEVFVCIGADESNIACLTTIAQLHKEDQRSSTAGGVWSSICRLIPDLPPAFVTYSPRCYAHIMNHDLLRAVRMFEQTEETAAPADSGASSKTARAVRVKSPPDLEIFSTPERTIWKLMAELERLKCSHWMSVEPVKQVHIQKDDTWHYILLGFGEFGRTLALSLAEQSHTSNRRRVRMTVCDREIGQKQREFLSRYSQFCEPLQNPSDVVRFCGADRWADDAADQWEPSPSTSEAEATTFPATKDLQPLTWVCRADFLEYHEVTDDVFFDALVERVCRPGVRTAVFVCFEDEKENFTTALRLNQKLKDRILQTSFPWPGRSQPADGEECAARLCWPVFAWLPRQMNLAEMVKKLEVQQGADQKLGVIEYRKKLAEAEQDKESLQPEGSVKADTQTTTVSPHLNYRPTLIPFGQNYENISYSEIKNSWLDWLAKLIHLVWEKPTTGDEEPTKVDEAHNRLTQLVQLHGSKAPFNNPWGRVFEKESETDFVPLRYQIEDWMESFAQIDWGRLEQTSDESWRRLNAWARYSNRSAAIHSVLKAAFFGLKIIGRVDHGAAIKDNTSILLNLTFGKLRILSEMEHNRWVAERLIDGWWFHEQRSERSRWQLIPFSDLKNRNRNLKGNDMKDQREKDAKIIMLVLGLIATGRLQTEPINSR